MPRQLLHPKRVNLYVPMELWEDLRDAGEDMGMSMSEIVRVAASEWLERQYPDKKTTVKDWDAWQDLWFARLASLMAEVQEHAVMLAKEEAAEEGEG